MPDTAAMICQSKQRYSTHAEASEIVRRKESRKHKPVHSKTCRYSRVYQCQVCGGWHLTSRKTHAPRQGAKENRS